MNPGPPAVALDGDMFEIEIGITDGVTEIVAGLEVPPPGKLLEEVVTVTVAFPGLATSPAGARPNIKFGPKYKVKIAVPLKLMTELVVKFEPSQKKPNTFGPATTVVGLVEVITGTRAFTGKITEADAPPPGSGSNTKTLILPAIINVRRQDACR